MGNLLNKFKLQKLNILAFDKKERLGGGKSMKMMFNPAGYHKKFAISYGTDKSIDETTELTYGGAETGKMTFKFVLDSTNVTNSFSIVNKSPSVTEQISQFMDLTYNKNDNDEPNYLRIEWGDLKFDCRLMKVDITYKLFDRDGTPLRAELDATFGGDVPVEKVVAKPPLADLTHLKTMAAGDSLPLTALAIYGSLGAYIKLAKHNKLNSFRNIKPGKQIKVPPLK